MKRVYISALLKNWKNWRFWAANLVLLALAYSMPLAVEHIPRGHVLALTLLALISIYFVIFAFTWLEAQWWQVAVIGTICLLYIAFYYHGGNPKRVDPQGTIIIRDPTK